MTLRGKSPAWWLECVLLPVALWLALMKFPHQPGVGLDDSWRMVLAESAKHGWQHGRDIVFTYGPLGHLMSLTYAGDYYWTYFGWQAVSNLVFTWLFVHFARNLSGWRRFFFYTYLLLFGTIYIDAMQMVQIMMLAQLLLRRDHAGRLGWIVFTGAFFGLFSLIKFTNLMLCAFIVAVFSLLWLVRREPRKAAWLSGTYVVTLLGVWLALGQEMRHLPNFLRYGLEVSMGYVEAMSVYETSAMFALGVAAWLGIIAYAFVYLATQADRLLAFASCLVLGAVSYINWKHGFVRADGHVLAHFVICMMIVSAYPALLDDNQSWPRTKNLLLGASAACALGGVFLLTPHSVYLSLGWFNRRLHDTVAILVDPAAHKRYFDQQLGQLKNRTAHIALGRVLNGATVDHLGDDQAYTILNGFNYTPRPAIQGYTAYTEALNRLDLDFYLSDRAPQFVVSRFTTIDGRLLTQDDSLTLRHVLQNYRYRFESGGLLVFERGQDVVEPEAGLPPVRRTVAFGEEIEVPDFDGRPVWVTIDVQMAATGRLRKFLYKLPHLFLGLTDQAGKQEEFRLVRQIAGTTGFLLNPLFTRGEEIMAYQSDAHPRRARRLSVRAMPGGEGAFRPEIHVEFRALRPLLQGLVNANSNLENGFRIASRRPVQVEAYAPMLSLPLGEREVLMIHAPSRMEFDLTPGDTSLALEFGVLPSAIRDGNMTDGVEFEAVWIAPDGAEFPLWRRWVDPAAVKADRGTLSARIDLSGRQGGSLRLSTLPGPAGNLQCDWSYWARIEFNSP